MKRHNVAIWISNRKDNIYITHKTILKTLPSEKPPLMLKQVFVLLSAFGTLETLIAVLQSFIPATLGQIWYNEVY